jgi:type I restriction enzyme S subunit
LSKAGHGAAQQNVSTTEIESVLLSIPNLVEQRATAEKFEDFAAEREALERVIRRKIAALEELKKSLLHQAFTGQL